MSDEPQIGLPPFDDLVAFIEGCSAYFRRDPSIRILHSRRREFQMTFGCCMQTIRYAESYLLLNKAGYSNEARTLARAALEHAVTVEYAFLHVDGFDQLAAEAEYSSWSLMQRMQQWGAIDPAYVLPAKPTARGLPKLTKPNGILAKLDPARVLLDPGYAMLSQSVHVTNQTVTQFFRVEGPDRSQLRLRPEVVDEFPEHTAYVLAAACMLATWMLAHVREDETELERLDALSDELLLPIRLDTHWPTDEVREDLRQSGAATDSQVLSESSGGATTDP